MRSRISLGVALGLLGCAEPGAQPAESANVRDSAGIPIVEHAAGSEARLPHWVVRDTPAVDIGGRNEPGQDLHLIGGAVRLSVYDTSGKLLRMIRSATPAEPVTAAHREKRLQETLAGIDRQPGSEQLKARCPDRVRPYEVGPNAIIGLWRDPDELHHVRVYAVSSP